MAKDDQKAIFGPTNPPPGGMPGAAMGEPGTQGKAQIPDAPVAVSGDPSVGGGKSFDPDNMIRTYLPGVADDPVKYQAVKRELQSYEKGSGTDYHSAIDKLVQAHPELGQYTRWGKAFPAQTPGQLSPQVMQQLADWTKAYQKPLTEAMQADTQSVMGALQGLLPHLPGSFQNLVKTQGPQLQHMGSEISTLLAQAQPGAIANAYSQYNAGTGTGTTAANPISSLLASGQQNPQTLTSDRNLKANITPVGW